MKNYLTHLIRRQQGEKPAIRPRLPSRFEHAAEIEPYSGTQFLAVGRPKAQVSAAVATKERHTPRDPVGNRDAKAGKRVTPEQSDSIGHDVDSKIEPLSSTQTGAPTSGAVQGSEMAVLLAEHEHSASQAIVAAREAHSLPQARVAEPSVKRLSASNVRTSRLVTLPEETRQAALQAGVTPQRNQEITTLERPLIRVTIGRIDVRADLNKAATPKPGSSARVPQPQPLAEYLKGRGPA